MPKRLARLAAPLALVTYVLVLFGATAALQAGLFERDGYYHARLSRLLPERGFSREFPWTQVSTWQHGYCDKEVLYHAAMMPFTLVGDEPIGGARVFAVLLSTAVMLALFLLLRAHGVPWPALFAALPLASGGLFIARLGMVSCGLAARDLSKVDAWKARWASSPASRRPPRSVHHFWRRRRLLWLRALLFQQRICVGTAAPTRALIFSRGEVSLRFMPDFTDIAIVAVDNDETLRNRIPGTSLYRVHLKLSSWPPPEWEQLFDLERRFPRHTMWRRAEVVGQYIVVECPIDEIERYHRPDLLEDVAQANAKYRDLKAREKARADAEETRAAGERAEAAEKLRKIKF